MQPLWTHDCKRCRFLGRVLLSDAYVCKSSLILRDGDDGPDYRSMPLELVRLVQERGKLPRDYAYALKLAAPFL